MFLQILYAVVKGLLEMDGYQVTAAKPAADVGAEPASQDCVTDENKCYK
ncbi:hypothetical protein [Rheinheimera texasensis]